LQTKQKQPHRVTLWLDRSVENHYGNGPCYGLLSDCNCMKTLEILLIAEYFYGTVAIFTHSLDPDRMVLPRIKDKDLSDIQNKA